MQKKTAVPRQQKQEVFSENKVLANKTVVYLAP